jgi:predicted nucleic acid-binding protein
MSSFICLDSSVLIKLLVNEEDSNKAVLLMEKANRTPMAMEILS